MKRHFFVKAILVLAAIGLFSAGMKGAFNAGWWQGYLAGESTEAQEGVTPYWGPGRAPFGHGHGGRGLVPHMGFRPFGLLRGLFTLALLLFLFALTAKVFGIWAWKRSGGKNWHTAWRHHGHPPRGQEPPGRPPHGPWGHHHCGHGPMPPWYWGTQEVDETEPGEAEPAEEQVAKVNPDTGESES